MDDLYHVETPEVVTITYRVAGVGSRCLAAVVDTLLILLLQAALGAVMAGITSFAPGGLFGADNLVLALWSLLGFALFWGYYILFELLWSGQSPGKRMVGLRVVREGGRPVDFSASALRNLIRAVDFLPFGYGVGVISMFADRNARRLGDFAAGTLVIREGLPLALDDLLRGVEPAIVPPRDPTAPSTPLLPNLELLRPDDYALAEAFLRRREQLSATTRAELAAALASALRARLQLPGAGGAPEPFLEHLVREARVLQAAEAQALGQVNGNDAAATHPKNLS